MISTHILDTSKGLPAKDVTVTLHQKKNADWLEVGKEKTNADGRIVFNGPKEEGDYKLTFHIEEYFKNEDHFFLNTPVIFRVKNTDRKYHVPLLLNPFGLSTYRGS